MTYRRLTALSMALASLLSLSASPARAAEVQAYTPDSSLLPARQPVEAPLRVAEALALDALATLVPAREGAASDLAALAAWNAAGERPTRVGFARSLAHPLDLHYDTALFPARIGSRVGGGFLARRMNGNWVWGTSVEIAEAKGLRLELADVNLPAGTRFWVYGMGGEARTFDLRLLREDRTILSPTIYGDRIYLEVELPEGAAGARSGLTISRVFELAIDDAGETAGELVVPEEGECADNAECFDSGDFPGIGPARNGVFRYTYQNGTSLFTCSGGLLNDADDSTLQPWLLTANHCLSSQSRALSLDSRFFWRFASCASGASVYTFGPLGADLIVHSATTDVALARAIDATEVPAGVTYLGWTTARPADGSILHRLSHPVVGTTQLLTQPQMYSTHQVDDTPAFFCGSPYTTTNFISSVNIADTGIAGGSSGSPVMRPDGRIVGQLFGACGSPPDGCATGDTANILDGAFATSYPLLAPYIDVAGVACVRDADTACLLNGKFKVEVTWTTSSATGTAKVMAFNGERAESTESAFFWFFNATNFEMGVKMVDACVAPFNRYWVFFSGLTSQGFQVKVTRMSDGFEKIYPPNPVNNIPTTTADTDAFTCL